MSAKPKVLILRTAGTNCDKETAFAFEHFGADVDLVHIKQLRENPKTLKQYHILAIPGGFSYGDDIESGRLLANEVRIFLGKALKKFVKQKKLVIGICNGFQVLVRTGLLPTGRKNMVQTTSLIDNESGKFEARWNHLKVEGDSVWTQGLNPHVFFPVAHAEGNFVVKDKKVLEDLLDNQQVAFRYIAADGSKPKYPDNPNGSIEDIAGITDASGRILGLMPHPERHFLFEHHPNWTALTKDSDYGDGAQIFKNGIEYVKANLL